MANKKDEIIVIGVDEDGDIETDYVMVYKSKAELEAELMSPDNDFFSGDTTFYIVKPTHKISRPFTVAPINSKE